MRSPALPFVPNMNGLTKKRIQRRYFRWHDFIFSRLIKERIQGRPHMILFLAD